MHLAAHVGDADLAAALLLAKGDHVADIVRRREDVGADDRLADFLDQVALRQLGRVVQRQDRAVGLQHFRSEEHTSELQSLMRISYAVFCLKKKKNKLKNFHIRYN